MPITKGKFIRQTIFNDIVYSVYLVTELLQISPIDKIPKKS